jgi:hypothetical protein
MGGMRLDNTPTQPDLHAAADSLRVLLDAYRSGAIEAPATMHAHLVGQIAALDAAAGALPTPGQ